MAGWGILCAVGLEAAGAAVQLEVGPVPEELPAGGSFVLVVRARDAEGQVVTNDSPAVRLHGMSPLPEWPVISEVDVNGQVVEITNPGESPVELSGWELLVGREDSSYGFMTQARLRFPLGTLLGGQSVCTVAGTGVSPGAFPAFVTPRPFAEVGKSFSCVRLLDAAGEARDEVYLEPYQHPASLTLWQGVGLKSILLTHTNVVHAREGDVNHFRNADWVTNQPPSTGMLNPGLTVPWSNRGDWWLLKSGPVTLTNGVWTGPVSGPSAVSSMIVVAEDGMGLLGRSTPIRVPPLPPLRLVVPEELRTSSEAAAGQGSTVTVQLPAATGADLTVALTWSAEGEFGAPPQVVVAAGSTAASFTVTNLDDPGADGMAQVTLTASAAGWTATTETLWNEDDESGALHLELPDHLPEGQGPVPSAGRVWLESPARHEVVVVLAADAPLQVPAWVVIPAGRSSAQFTIDVGEDAFVDPDPWQVAITAQTGGWPSARALQTLLDDESRGLTILPPAEVVEGRPARGLIRLQSVRSLPLVVQLNNPDPTLRARMGWPQDILVPAGVLEQEFFIEVPDNSEPEREERVEIQYLVEGDWQGAGHYVQVLDDDAPLAGVEFGSGFPRAVFSGQSFPIKLRLISTLGSTFQGPLGGRLEVVSPSTVATFVPPLDAIAFTNGRWEGAVTLEGTGLGLQLRVTTAGQEAISTRFDLLRGYEHGLRLADVQWWPAGQRLLALEPMLTNRSARLTELEPLTGVQGRSLDLPGTPALLTVSEGGGLAWLTTTSNALIRVDLANWRVTGVSALVSGLPQTAAQALLAVPGQPESVVAVVATNPTTGFLTVRRYVAGQALPAIVTAPVPFRVPTRLVASPTEPVFWGLYWSGLNRFRLTDEGLVLEQTWSASNSDSLDLGDGLLVAGDGRVWSDPSGASEPPFRPVQGRLGCLMDARGVAIFAELNGVLGYFDVASRQRLASHRTPSQWAGGWLPSLTRVFPWGDSGLALFYKEIGLVSTLQSPVLESGPADLVVILQAPERVEVPQNQGGVSFDVTVTVTNRGPGVALGVELSWNDGAFEMQGNLKPGEGFATSLRRSSGQVGLILTRVATRCVLTDPVPGNNAAEVATVIEREAVTGAKQLVLGSNHLVASPDGSRLYASLARTSGAATNAIAIVDPTGPVVERLLGIVPGPHRIAVSGDGRFLYTGLEGQGLARWDLTTHTNDLFVELPVGPFIDLAVLPDAPRSVVVLAGTRLTVYDDGQPRGVAVELPQPLARLSFASDLLWVILSDHLESFEVTSAGLESRRTLSFAPPWGNLDFSTDGRRLYFSGVVFDTLSLSSQPAPYLYNPSRPDPGLGVLYSPIGNRVQRLNLTSLASEGEQIWPDCTEGFVQDLVRWGADGLAARSGAQLLVVRSPLVPATVSADLAVEIAPPVAPRTQVSLEWSVVVTNHSTATIPRSELLVQWGELPEHLEVEGPPFVPLFTHLSFDLGELAGGQSVFIRLRGTLQAYRDYTLTARVLGAATDPVPENNTASAPLYLWPPQADLGLVSIAAPSTVAVGQEFVVDAVFTNAGPDLLPLVKGGIGGAPDQEYTLVRCEGCETNLEGELVLGEVPAASSRSIRLHLLAREPGLYLVSVYGDAGHQDPTPSNGSGATMMLVEPVGGSTGTDVRFPPDGRFSWDPRSRRLLAIFPWRYPGVVVLDPDRLAPVGEVRLGGGVSYLTPCRDGLHAWLFGEQGFTRVNYVTGVVDLQFAPDPIPEVWAMASPAANPDLLVLVTGDGVARAFDRGLALPNTHGPGNLWSRLSFTPDGRLFAAGDHQLRELALGPQGVSEVRNLDAATGWGVVDYSDAGGRLFGVDGRVIDLTTGQWVGTWPVNMADAELGVALSSPGCCGPLTLQSYDARTAEPRWRLELPATPVVLTLGTNGFLTTANNRYTHVPLSVLGPEQTDLTLIASAPAVAPGVGYDVTLAVSLTNRSPWAAREARLQVVLSPGLEVAPGQPGAGTTNAWIVLGSVIDRRNQTLRLRPTGVGQQVIAVQVSSALPDREPADDIQSCTLLVPDVPRVLVDDTAVLEDDQSVRGLLQARLSWPVPALVEVPFVITPLSAQADDFQILSGTLSFAPGQTLAVAGVVRPDDALEPDETASVQLQPVASAFLVRTNALLTIRNDDVPQVTVPAVGVREGGVGTTNAVVRLDLSTAAPFPVECWIRTAPGTAQSGEDFLPRESWVVFAPGETVHTVSVPVLGDVAFEPSETVLVNLVAVRGGQAGEAYGVLTIQNDDAPPQPEVGLLQDSDGTLRLEFPTDLGAIYQVQYRTNLATGSWQFLGNPVSGSGQPTQTLLGQPTVPASFYRVRAQ